MGLVGTLLWGVRAPSLGPRVWGRYRPQNSLFQPPNRFLLGEPVSACRNLPCPPRDLFTPSPGRTFRVPPLFCVQRSATLPRARLAAPGTAPGTETRPVSLGPARPRCCSGAGQAQFGQNAFVVLEPPGPGGAGRGGWCPTSRSPQKRLSNPISRPVCIPIPGAVSLPIFPGSDTGSA